MKICIVNGCDFKVRAKGLCRFHYFEQYRKNNKEKITSVKKEYYNNNKEEIKKEQKQYRIENKEDKNIYNKEYGINNKEKISKQKKNYYKDNKGILMKKSATYRRNRNKTDSSFKLRLNISRSINKALTKNKSSKQGESCLKYLPNTIEELKIHIESLFEPWMTWENHGIYVTKSWNDSDQSTWKWQIDHIIPHSTFQYTSMEVQSFKDCWSLDNLRPYSAKQNNIDGSNRTRHKGSK